MAGPALAIVVLASIIGHITGQAVNVALNKPVTALYTCGIWGYEKYNNLQDSTTFNPPRRYCYHETKVEPGTPEADLIHPPRSMVDGDATTWWQSPSRMEIYDFGQELSSEANQRLEAIIDLNLLQEFLVEQIQIQMFEALTPQRIAILKSVDGKTFDSWIFAVSNLDMCVNDFATTSKTIPASLTDVICVYYDANYIIPGDLITIDVTSVPFSLKEWTRIRQLKIKFYDMLFISPLNEMANTYNHYAVSELTVLAECPCNGQQEGCVPSEVTGTYECVCGGNTMGRFCENCQPMFNQFSFEFGEDCVECNCNQHAQSCIYQSSVDARNGSMDTQGVYKGGGVCVDCKHNTQGYNCEQCADMYYRPTGRVQTAEDACVPCGCDASGSTSNPETLIVDCVMNDDTVHPDGKLPGDCYCKENVQGSKCTECKVGFYKLERSNPDGCTACGCYTPGTVGASELCDPDAVGQCTCKANVEGRACNQCKDGFYGLTGENVDGCVPCSCDVGGSKDQVCDKLTGQCVCRSDNINGRACDGVRSSYFFPSTHFVSEEMETSFGDISWQRNLDQTGYSGQGYALGRPGESFSVLLTVPLGTSFSQQYMMIVHYRTDPQSLDPALITITREAGELSRSLDLPMADCDVTWCQSTTQGLGFFTLSEGSNLMTITVKSGTILLDKLTALPEEYVTVDPELGITFPAGCDVITNTLPSDPALAEECESAIFSLTMTYWNSPLQCNCDVIGSTSSTCDLYGGQCHCRPHVIGRRCDTCDVGHFALTSTGCTACDCDAVSTVCDQISGQCECPDNTVGRQCELCVPDHWGWDQQLGCQACDCDPLGSDSLQCNSTTGICTCKEGSEGDKCDVCSDGFFNVPGQGCTPCGCNLAGSVGPVCNKTSGDCDCKASVNGSKCDQCLPGTFGLDETNPNGCLDCVCMGVTTECTSANVFLMQSMYPLAVSDGNGSSVANLPLATADGTDYEFGVEAAPLSDGTMGLTINLQVEDPRLYWKLPQEMVDSLLHLYKTTIEFNITYVIVEGTPFSDLSVVMLLKDGTTYSSALAAVPQQEVVSVSVLLEETQWLKAGATPTRPEFLVALSQATAVLLPASFSAGKHTSRLSALMYSVDNAEGERNTAVEECECTSDYLGLSCQLCAPGLRRVNQSESDYLGVCAPCECNSHSSTCDPDTSVCIECQHNTDGPSCEVCAVGFYGDATAGTAGDCTECPCYPPRVVNGTCEPVLQADNTSVVTCLYCNEGYEGTLCDTCSTFHYGTPDIRGGTCTPCDCNNNSDQCDPITGLCSECGSDTTGDNCQLCNPNFYGNASTQSCQACDCVPDTSDQAQCDAVSGQCVCAPGVTGRTCDQCLPGYWGFNVPDFRGCRECGCVEAGSEDIQCDSDTGQCPCKPLTAGVTCDTCQDGYFGPPCQDCTCDVTGTTADTVCDKGTGQCQCKDGITGRTCDQCLPFYVDFSETGCTECGPCQRSLEDNINTLIDTTNKTQAKADEVLAIQEEDARLIEVTAQLDASLDSLGLQDNVTSLSDLVAQAQADLDQLNADFTTTSSEVDAVYSSLVIMDGNAQAQLVRHTDMKTTALYLDSNVTQFQTDLEDYIQRLSVYNASASEYLTQGGNSTALTLSLDAELATADELLAEIEDDSARAPIDQKVTDQAAELVGVEATVATLESDLAQEEVNLAQASDMLNQATYTSSLVENAVDEGMLYKSQVEELVEALEEILDSAEAENAEILSTLNSAEEATRNTETIYSGNAATLVSGADVPPFPPDVTNFETAKVSAEDLISSVPILVDRVDDSILEAEQAVIVLDAQLLDINNTYASMDQTSQDAVQAIDNYNLVVEDLDNAVQQSIEAEKLINDVRDSITGDNLVALELEYGQEKNSSEALLEEYQALDYKPSVLQSLLTDAESRLGEEPAQWQAVDDELDAVTALATDLNDKIAATTLEEDIAGALSQLMTADGKSQSVLDTANQQGDVVTQKEAQYDLMVTQSQKIAELEQTITEKLASHEAERTAYNEQTATASSLTESTDTDKQRISDKIDLLESKLADVESLLGQLKQPVSFDGSLGLTLDNPVVNEGHAYDDVTIEVKKREEFTDGVLFFVESSTTASEIQVGVEGDQFFMQFNAGSDLVKVVSPAVVCDGCWAKIYASRYLTTGQLTVQLMETGGSVSTSSTGTDTNSKDMLLTSPVYLGTLPDTQATAKVTNRTFKGCLQEVTYQTETYSLWSALLDAGQTADCCQAPNLPASPSMVAGVSFQGFGHTVLGAPGSLDMSQVVLVRMELRTFQETARAFAVISENGRTKFSIGLDEEGLVYWEVISDGLITYVKSQRKYAGAGWIEVIASVEASVLRLTVNQVDQPGAGSDVSTVEKPEIDFGPLAGQDLIFGTDQDPFSNGYEANSENFAGCLRNVQLTTNTLTNINFASDVKANEGVDTNGCYQSVVEGFRFDSDSAFLIVSASSEITALRTLDIDFVTDEPRGILFYIHPVDSTRYLYIAVFGGQLAVVYKQDTAHTVLASDQFVSDGQIHTLRLNCFTSRVTLFLDGRVFEEDAATLASTFLTFPDSSLIYVGGVRDGVTLEADLPVRTSLVGGITSLTINDLAIGSEQIADMEAVSLAGIPTPSGAELVPPLPDQPTQEQCAVDFPPILRPLDQGALIDGFQQIVWSDYVPAGQLQGILLGSFIFNLEFAAYKADGVLLYAANSDTSVTEYMTLFMENGLLKFTVRTSTGSVHTVTLTGQYNDNQRYLATGLRINDFISLNVEAQKDISTNGANPETASQLTIPDSQPVFVGGVDSTSLAVSALPASFKNDPNKSNFAGAIFSLNIDDNVTVTANLVLSDLDRSDFPAVPQTVAVGAALAGDGSYLDLGEMTTGNSAFKIQATVTTTLPSTVLFALVKVDTSQFYVVDVVDQTVRLHLSPSFAGVTDPFMLELLSASGLCDDQPHVIQIDVKSSQVTLTIDDGAREVTEAIPQSHDPVVLSQFEFYFGGFPAEVSAVLPANVDRTSLSGCVHSMTFDAASIDPTDFVAQSNGASYGCPV